VLNYQVMKTYRGVEEQFGALLTPALNEFQVQLHAPAALPQASFAPGIASVPIRRWVGPSPSLGTVKTFFHCQPSNLDS
jgi:hypothetical protein